MQGEILKCDKWGDAVKITALIYGTEYTLEKVIGFTGKEVKMSIELPKEKRSLVSNNYLWALIRELAKKIHGSTNWDVLEKIYIALLKRYGQSIVVTVNSKYDISKAGFKYYEVFKDGLINGKPFTAYKIFIGSSQYTTEEMQKLIEGTKQECKELGIETELDNFSDLMA